MGTSNNANNQLNNNPMNIALVYSPNWSQYVAVEVFAIFATNPAPMKVYLVSDGECTIDTDRITKLFGEGYSIEYIDMLPLYKEKITSEINVTSRFTKYVLYRLMFPYAINEDRLLYIDADAIVNGDLTDFYNMDMCDNLLAGVADCGDEQYNLKGRIGLSQEDAYINAGVTLLNLAKIRQCKIGELSLADVWIKEANTKRYNCQDQDIWNLTCRGRVKEIPLAYNVSVSTGLDIDSDKIKIMHYAGPADEKPWRSNKAPFVEIWHKWASEYSKTLGR